MNDEELKELIEKDIPNVPDIKVDSKKIIQRCEDEKACSKGHIVRLSLISSLVVIIASVLCLVLLTNKATEYVNVSFKVEDIMFDAKIDKGTKITDSNLSCLKKMDYSNLYYDSEKKEKYNNESVNKEITLYVELKEKDYSNMTEEELLLQIREDYLNQWVIPSFGEEYTIDGVNYYKYTIDDVNIYNNFGCYNGSYVVLFSLTGEGVGWNLLKEYVIGGVSLVFPTLKRAYVWHNGYFYYLETAYDKGLLTVDDLESIALVLQAGQTKIGNFYSLDKAFELGMLTIDDLNEIIAINHGDIEFNEVIDEHAKQKIKNDRLFSLRNDYNYENAKMKDITIVRYYGNYNGTYVISLADAYSIPSGVLEHSFAVTDSTHIYYFKYYGEYSIIVWSENVYE